MKYIILPSFEIGNPQGNTINVLTPEQLAGYKSEGYKLKERMYKITIGHRQYELICAEIWKKGDMEHSLIVPAFLIPRRPYPLYVYAFAINLYSSNSQMGQRAVAEETRKRFGLETFSHTTVGRAIKALADRLEKSAIANAGSAEVKDETSQAENKHNGHTEPIVDIHMFPTVADTQARRKIITSFFNGRLDNHNPQVFKEECERIAICWYSQNNQLLM